MFPYVTRFNCLETKTHTQHVNLVCSSSSLLFRIYYSIPLMAPDVTYKHLY